jgi:RNA polymerase primary sigma factor
VSTARVAEPADNVGLYLRDISRIDLLDADEERRVAERARSGDRQALELLVRSNLRFVVSMARKYGRSGYPLDELINEGNIGLLEAARRFDPDRGVRFVSYAGWWVRQAILAAIARNGQAYSVPPKLKFEQYRFEQRVRELAQDLSRPPDVDEIASALEMEEQQVRSLLTAIPSTLSLSDPLGDDGFEIEDTIADPRDTGIDDLLMARSFRRFLDLALEQLSSRERYIVERRFGLGDGAGDDRGPATLAEIGAELGLSRERVRQIEARAMDKLRRSERAHQLRDFLGVQLN